MNNHPYTDEVLEKLKAMPKKATNPKARWLNKPKTAPSHRQRNIQATGEDEAFFVIYQRQSLFDQNDFSCGIEYRPASANSLTLARYNGASHIHGDIAYRAHIHQTTEQAILAGGKPESRAAETDRYRTLEGAMACLLDDFNVTGIESQHDEQKLL